MRRVAYVREGTHFGSEATSRHREKEILPLVTKTESQYRLYDYEKVSRKATRKSQKKADTSMSRGFWFS